MGEIIQRLKEGKWMSVYGVGLATGQWYLKLSDGYKKLNALLHLFRGMLKIPHSELFKTLLTDKETTNVYLFVAINKKIQIFEWCIWRRKQDWRMGIKKK